jgi:Mg2+ and Co2+ transporter CorA
MWFNFFMGSVLGIIIVVAFVTLLYWFFKGRYRGMDFIGMAELYLKILTYIVVGILILLILFSVIRFIFS